MSENTTTTEKQEVRKEARPGFFGRLFEKIDRAMQAKAEEKSQQGCCCDSDSGKGGKAGKGDKCC
jgi:hypothetical protein